MKLEVSKRYKDKYNRVFTIISDQARLPYCYVGESTERILVGFTHDGKALLSAENLVSEVKEPQKFEGIVYAFYNNWANFNDAIKSLGLVYSMDKVHSLQAKYRITIEEIVE